MAFTLNIPFPAGADNTDPANLTAELQTHNLASSSLPAVTATLSNAGGNYFKHLGAGFFSFEYAAFPAGFRGAVVIKYSGTVIAVVGINPEEAEDIIRIRGLVGENQGIIVSTADANGNLLTGSLFVYDTAVNAALNDGVTGVIASYSMTNVYSGAALSTAKVAKAS